MTGVHAFSLIVGATVLAAMVELLRRRQLREKYAALWLAVSTGILTLSVFPRLLDVVAARIGIADPPNLLALLGLVFVLGVCAHLSWEVSRLEDETRELAEELALLRFDVEELGKR